MTLHTKYKESLEELYKFTDEQLKYHDEKCFGNGHNINCPTLKFKSHLKTHTLNLIDELIKREEGRKEEIVKKEGGLQAEWTETGKVVYFYLSDTLSYLKEQRDLVANE